MEASCCDVSVCASLGVCALPVVEEISVEICLRGWVYYLACLGVYGMCSLLQVAVDTSCFPFFSRHLSSCFSFRPLQLQLPSTARARNRVAKTTGRVHPYGIRWLPRFSPPRLIHSANWLCSSLQKWTQHYFHGLAYRETKKNIKVVGRPSGVERPETKGT